MARLAQSGGFTLEDGAMTRIRDEFAAGRCDEAATARTIADTLARSGYLLDPHTATGVHVANQLSQSPTPMVVLATAHPAKFPDAVEAASGVRPELPEELQPMMSAPERMERLPAGREEVEAHVLDHARAARETSPAEVS
jgi:threonine synthase